MALHTDRAGTGFWENHPKRQEVYLHVFDWPNGALELDGMETRVASVSMLAGGKALHFTQKQGHLKIEVPAQAPDPDATVLVLKTR